MQGWARDPRESSERFLLELLSLERISLGIPQLGVVSEPPHGGEHAWK